MKACLRLARRSVVVILALTFLATLTLPVFGRVGGGHSFSGGGGHGGGGGGGGGSHGGGGGGGGLVELLILLTIEHPYVGIPLIVICIVGYVIYKSNAPQSDNHTSYSSKDLQPTSNLPQVQDRSTPERMLEHLRDYDANFSPILFTDFTYALYAAVHEARGRRDLATYAPYLHPNVIHTLQQLGQPSQVSGIIVAAWRLGRVTNPDGPQIDVVVEFETNYTETVAGRQNTWYSRERWSFRRDVHVLSRPPERITALHCPKCGGALEQSPDGACRHCGVKILGGKFDWYVVDVQILERSSRGPALTTTQPEVGTDERTIYQRDFDKRRERFLARNPRFDWDRLIERVRLIFTETQKAWSDMHWETARPYVSDSLFQMLNYWISEYRRQQLRNVLEDVNIEKTVPVKITSDAFYDALTFRIFASMRDYTIDKNGKYVCGDKSGPRRFSEYWTFIRRRGVKESSQDQGNCPNCGAALKINMAGICEYCQGKVTSGEFNWVLSRIEQDETYTG
jgi:predicted lipid-binding transport protein (Tim44 family)